MQDVAHSAKNVLDVWPYIEQIPPTDLEGHFVEDQQLIEAAYRTNDGRYDHVLAITKTANVYLVIVIDLINDSIYGHHLLDLNREYGLQ